jgi:hypothetical protein
MRRMLIEISSRTVVHPQDARQLFHFENDIPGADFFLISREEQPLRMGSVWALNWREALLRVFGIAR